MKYKGSYIAYSILFACMLFFATNIQADEGDLSATKVHISKSRGTVYELLQQITAQTGYYFTYDSQLINNNKNVKINKGEYRLLEAVHKITGNPELKIGVVDNHMLLYANEQWHNNQSINEEKKSYYPINGSLYDKISGSPISYGLVFINGTNISTATNHNGEFRLVVPDSLPHIVVKSSHLGYESKEFEASISTKNRLTFALAPQYTSLQEAVVRVVNPLQQIQKMLDNRGKNYSSKPVNMTTFYREIAEFRRSKTITESVLYLYKPGYHDVAGIDYAKLVKRRAITAQNSKDSLVVKLKAGVNSALQLDIIKDPISFLMLNESEIPYTFWYAGMTNIDEREIYIISFEQKKNIKEALYKGLLFIDAENNALVEVQFEVNPCYVRNETHTYVLRQPKTHKITLQRAAYVISYRPNNDGVYHLSQVQGDIAFKIKKRQRFIASPLKVTFEMIVCDIKTENVKTFPKEERLQTHKIFSDIKHPYDISFWESFNTILPENEIRKFIQNNLLEISETLPKSSQ